MKRIFLLICCLGLLCAARGQTHLHYWFDGLDSAKVTIPMTETNRLNTQLDVNDLSAGVHSLYLMVEDAEGKLGSPVQRTFIRSMSFDENLYYRCWFDNDESTSQTGELADGAIMLDVANLSDGLHTVFVQAYGNFVTSPQSYQFLKVPNVVGNEELTYICLIDDQLYTQQTVPGTQEVIHLDMDVAPLSQGVHKLQIMLATESGAVTGAYTSYFYRAILQTEITEARLVYMVDGKEQPAASATSATNGTLHYDLDVSSLSNGLHSINYALVGSNGVYGTGTTQWFYKIPIGGEGLVSYEYWLNDDEANMHHVDLAEHVSAYHLVSLLPVDQVPVRSSLFQFAFKNDTLPVVYAKNDFHVRFWESGGSYALADAQYVDERSCDTIYADTLRNSNTISMPKKDTIYWYCVQAKAGDSLAIKTNKACNLHIFSPSAEEVYSADAVQSVSWGGCHANETGMYYIALHDYKADALPSIKLSSMHIDRYALLDYTPKRVGYVVGNMFSMNLYGNGFDKLTEVYLQKEDNIIYTDTIYNTSKSETSLMFSFSQNILLNDTYDIVLVFEDNEETEEIIKEEAVYVESPHYGDIEVECTSVQTIDNPYTVTVSITNTGNVNYSWIPFNFAFDRPELLSDVRFSNFGIAIPAHLDSLGYQFATFTDNLLGKHVNGVMFFLMIPQLLPYETKKFDIDLYIEVNETLHFYAWAGVPVELDPAAIPYRMLIKKARKEMQNALNILSAGEYISGALGFVPNPSGSNSHLPNPASMAGAVGNNALQLGVTMAGISNASAHIGDMARLKQYGIDPSDPLYGQIQNLHPPVATPGHIWGGFGGALLDNFMGFQRDCAQNPQPNPGNPHEVTRPDSYDPNDIRGYISESGSKYMRQDIETIHYEIEFENDTAVATAPAHTIIVRDTLNADRFDLSSFDVTEVTIGDRKMAWTAGQNGTQTMDMRTRMNVIAQVTLDYNTEKGIAVWTITSLDPMTMEPITDADLGVLPVNFDGNGMGTISYRINLKNRFDDGTQIANRASIIFDNNQPILTPVWINTVDTVSPTSEIVKTDLVSDSLTFCLNTADSRSGVWRRDVYARINAEDEWQVAAQSVTDTVVVTLTDGWRQFYVLAVDSAGNIETKTPNPEYSLVLDTYLITFYDEDGTTVLDAREWDYGMIPSCEIPRKEADQLYRYEFDQWIPALAPVTTEAAYTASYKALPLITTDLQDVLEKDPSAQKLLRGGQLLILRGDKIYTATGQEVR